MPRPALLVASLVLLAACSSAEPTPREPLGYMPTAVTTAQPEWIPFTIRAGKPVEGDPRERHLADLRRLTFAQGDNAEASWSPDGKKLIFHSTRDGGCQQTYVLDLRGGDATRVSNGEGRATGGAFVPPRGERVVFASTHAKGKGCPEAPDPALGYVWPLDEYDLYTASADGSDLRALIGSPGYDAEAAIASDGSRLVFTSARDGDPDLYTAKADGTDVRRITSTLGYDGGAFFSPDRSRLVWRASRPAGADVDAYRALLAKRLVRPTALEIMVGGSEGQNARPLTKNGKANFGPSFMPDSRRVIFASNVDAPPSQDGPSFDLYIADADGPASTNGVPALERVTFDEGFDGFPRFSPDGEHVVFASNRQGSKPGEMNLFVARWVE